mmetsp:Transcript_62716/g.161977  ORF Transcript_62716/g.161977 Transcript_62716/m.161977 type:complete len:201 (-) Transcript_62716:55-657(-)
MRLEALLDQTRHVQIARRRAVLAPSTFPLRFVLAALADAAPATPSDQQHGQPGRLAPTSAVAGSRGPQSVQRHPQRRNGRGPLLAEAIHEQNILPWQHPWPSVGLGSIENGSRRLQRVVVEQRTLKPTMRLQQARAQPRAARGQASAVCSTGEGRRPTLLPNVPRRQVSRISLVEKLDGHLSTRRPGPGGRCSRCNRSVG